MYKKIIAATLIALQAAIPAYAVPQDAKYYYRHTKDVMSASAPDAQEPTAIPEVSVGNLRGNVGAVSITSEPPGEVLGSIANLLQGGVASVVFDGYAPSIAGLSLNASGQLVGVPTSAYQGAVYVSYHDEGNRTGRIKVPVSIYPSPALTSSKSVYTVPENGDTAAYGIEVYPANDGFYDGVIYSLSPSSAPLPEGLSLSGGSIVGQIGAIGGTNHVVTIRGTSESNPEVYAERSVTISVADVLPMALDLKPDAPLKWALDEQAGKLAYAEKFSSKPTPTGSFRKPLTWSLALGSNWLNVDADGYLKGVPTAVGDFEATVMVEDADGQIASDQVRINVAASGYVFLTPGVQNVKMRVGETFRSQAPTVSNARGTVKFSTETGNLGKTLRLDENTGVVSGTWRDDGLYWVRLHVTDEQGRKDADGALPDTRYGVKLYAVNPVYISTATVKKISGVANAARRPIVVQWGKTFNLIGTPEYSILGDLPGTVWVKYYDDNDPTKLAIYVNDAGGSIGQNAGESAAQTVARLGANPFVFDTATMTLSGVSPIPGTFTVYLNVHDSHAEEGYTANPGDTARDQSENFTTPGVRVIAAESVMDPVNSVDEQYLSALTTPANVTTQILDSKTGDQWSGGTSVTWQLLSGSLPPGVTSQTYQSGRVRTYSGYPTVPGTYEVVWAVEDSSGISAETVPVKFVVHPREALSYTVTPGQQVTAVAGVDMVDVQITPQNRAEGKAVTWSYTGALPQGVTQSLVNQTNGIRFSGVPTQAGTYNVTAEAVDTSGATITVPVQIVVEEMPQVDISVVWASGYYGSNATVTYPANTLRKGDIVMYIGVGNTVGGIAGLTTTFTAQSINYDKIAYSRYGYKVIATSIPTSEFITVPTYGFGQIIVIRGATSITQVSAAEEIASSHTMPGFTQLSRLGKYLLVQHDHLPTLGNNRSFAPPTGFTTLTSGRASYYFGLNSMMEAWQYQGQDIVMPYTVDGEARFRGTMSLFRIR